MCYNSAVIHYRDGRPCEYVEYNTSKSDWQSRLRGLRRACKKHGIEVCWNMWAYLGGNSWTGYEIMNA
jgi:hypothetical protein